MGTYDVVKSRKDRGRVCVEQKRNRREQGEGVGKQGKGQKQKYRTLPFFSDFTSFENSLKQKMKQRHGQRT
jgi:hypothetical protein